MESRDMSYGLVRLPAALSAAAGPGIGGGTTRRTARLSSNTTLYRHTR
ncbi:hypothetical protein [Variovorax sp. V512]